MVSLSFNNVPYVRYVGNYCVVDLYIDLLEGSCLRLADELKFSYRIRLYYGPDHKNNSIRIIIAPSDAKNASDARNWHQEFFETVDLPKTFEEEIFYVYRSDLPEERAFFWDNIKHKLIAHNAHVVGLVYKDRSFASHIPRGHTWDNPFRGERLQNGETGIITMLAEWQRVLLDNCPLGFLSAPVSFTDFTGTFSPCLDFPDVVQRVNSAAAEIKSRFQEELEVTYTKRCIGIAKAVQDAQMLSWEDNGIGYQFSRGKISSELLEYLKRSLS